MKKHIVKNFLVIWALVVSTMAFAQEPGDFGDGTDPNPTDAPIGDYIWILAVIGLVYVFYKMRNKIKIAN